jgi:hypothetical protein
MSINSWKQLEVRVKPHTRSYWTRVPLPGPRGPSAQRRRTVRPVQDGRRPWTVGPNLSNLIIWQIKMSCPIFLVNNVVSTFPILKPFERRKSRSLSYQAWGACFNPYNALENLYTWLGFVGSSKPGGCCWQIKDVSLYDPQAYGPHTFFTTGFPRFLSIRGARGLQAIDLLRHT